MSPRNRRWLAALAVGVPVLLALLFQDFFREALVVPILYAFWVIYLYVTSLPQAVLWGLFLGVSLLIVLGGLGGSGRIRRRGGREDEDSPGRVSVWAERVELARRGGYFQKILARHLGKLAIEALARRRRLEPDEIKRRLEMDALDLDLPPEARAYLRLGLDPSLPGDPRVRRALRALDPEAVVRLIEEEISPRGAERTTR
jgi:hypothetical protein